MFTGIVEEIGTVTRMERRGDKASLQIAATLVTEGTRIGDSIAVNGVCQTVSALSPASFTVEALAETLKKTTFGGLGRGDRVHLERALTLSARLGGHLVQGHVSGRASVRQVRREGENVYLVLAIPRQLEKYCVLEGSIAIDGVSLTICALAPGELEVNLIPLTRECTTLGDKKPGDEVNIENDMIAKYVERLLVFKKENNDGTGDAAENGLAESRLESLLKSSF